MSIEEAIAAITAMIFVDQSVCRSPADVVDGVRAYIAHSQELLAATSAKLPTVDGDTQPGAPS